MSIPRLNRLLEFIASLQPELAMFWLGLALFTAGLGVLLYTRWGQYKPLRKCMALSLLAHLLLATYAATIQMVTPRVPSASVMHVAIGDMPGVSGADQSPLLAQHRADTKTPSDEQPWLVLPGETPASPKAPELERAKADPKPEPRRVVQAEPPKLAGELPLRDLAVADAKPLLPRATPKAASAMASEVPPPAIEAPRAQRREPEPTALPAVPERLAADPTVQPVRPLSDDLPLALLQPPEALPQLDNPNDAGPDWRSTQQKTMEPALSVIVVKPSDPIGRNADPSRSTTNVQTSPLELASRSPSRLATGPAPTSDATLPDAYRLRVAPNKAQVAQSRGGTAETETAVKAALKWLADNQAADGRWDPRVHGAGKEANVLGRARQSAGSKADSAVTGLALLAFLAAGHTHVEGPYQDDVRRGLEYLIRIQASDGNLAGHAATFEFMYSHAIAACAVSEAYGMTHDSRLRACVRRAIAYSVAAQDRIGGGWRYKPGDAGDTSQLGWQLMSLKSAELAGIPIPDTTRQGIVRYLRSVSSGKFGGHASYRPGEQATRSMSAEALVCWQFLGLPREHPACNEAGDFLLGELPGDGQSNVYYWYYATLAMYQLQGVHWQRWNDAIQATVVSRQVKRGPLAGSWNTDDLWGGYGGRVFTTALSTLCLEVYYRWLPLYGGISDRTAATR